MARHKHTPSTMSKATITFHKLIQDTQDLAASDPNQNHMLSKVFFTLDIGEQHYRDMSAILRQPFGTDYSKEPIEAEKPSGSYGGNWNHNAFRYIAEDYYRSAIGSQGGAIRLGPDSQNIRMQENTFVFSKSYQVEISD